MKWKEKVLLVSVWHNDGRSCPTLKTSHVLGHLNYGILRIYSEYWKKNRKKVLVGCQKNLVHRKIHRQIKTLGKSYRNCRSVSHELTPQQAQGRVDICRQLIGNTVDDRFIRRIVICDNSVPVKLPKSSLKNRFWWQKKIK